MIPFSLRANHGFTLIEVMIAIMILAVISVLSAQSIQSGISSRTKISRDIERESSVRDALKVMERDINRAFHYRDISQEMMKQIKADMNKSTTGNVVNNPYNPNIPQPPADNQDGNQANPPKQLTQFIGEADSLHFTTLNHVRTARDAKESDQAEVGYYLQTCRSRTDKKHSSQCLWRRESPTIDDKVTEGGAAIVLLENVQEFKLSYFGADRDEWVPSWKSDESGDSVSKDRFPYAVEIHITMQNKDDKNDKKISMATVAVIDFPNNEEKKQDANGNTEGVSTPQ